MSISDNVSSEVANLDIPLERDGFLRDLVRHLSGSLQDVVGVEEASGFISIVGQKIGEDLNATYRSALKVENLNRPQVAQVLVDLKKRIQGDFFIIEQSDEKIVFGNNKCPFGDKVLGRPALCMMTSNVFGAIAADNLGFSKISLEETIASGSPGCRVVLYLKNGAECAQADGREYFKDS